MFRIKKAISFFFDMFFVNKTKMYLLNKKYGNNYIRIINYHHVENRNSKTFEKQLKWYKNHYTNIDRIAFKNFVDGSDLHLEKPGLMITFDDGYKDNYENAFPLLKKYGFTGYYMVSSDLIGKSDYMTCEMLLDLLKSDHVIGCHTATHHRFNNDDSGEVLYKEIVDSKKQLEKALNSCVDIFCWCGGEEQHYTRNAAEIIYSAGYKYSFLTNSYPVLHDSNLFLLERTNIDSSWQLYLVRFQLCGIIDDMYKKKRYRVEKLVLDGMKCT